MRAERSDRERPASITLLASLHFAGVPLGAFLAVAAPLQWAPDPDVAAEATIMGAMAVPLSIAFGVGFLRGHRWTRLFILYGTPLAMAVELVTGENRLLREGFSVPLFILGGLFYAGYAYILTRPDVRAFFAKKAP